MKKDWIQEGYRRWFNTLNEELPEETWTGIADQLDIDEVWDKLNEELDRAERPGWTWAARVAAVLALLISALAAYWYLSPSPKESRTPLAQQAPLPPASSPEGAGGDTAADTASPGNAAAEINGLSGEEDTGDQPLEQEILATSPPQFEENGGNLQAMPAVGATVELSRPPDERSQSLKVPEKLIASIPAATGKEADAANRHPFVRLQRIGLVSAYKNTWMLNHETFNGLRSSTLNATAFTYGTSAGITAGFLLDGKHKVSAELYLRSYYGQDYRQYIEARYQSRRIALDYYRLQLFYQLPVFSGKGDVLAGIYGSYLKRGREKIADEARTVGRFYRNIDYGIMAGYQFNLPVNDRLLLHPGIRVNYGLPNIFKGNQHIPENFLRTHNAAAGLYLGVSYRLY